MDKNTRDYSINLFQGKQIKKMPFFKVKINRIDVKE